jgi:multiple antibiotic resistance protein
MEDFLKNLLLAFIPLFVAVDAAGVLPVFVSLAGDLEARERRRIIIESMVTALCMATAFIFLGRAIFRFLGITVGDFMVAGGLVLLCIAILDVLSAEKGRRKPGELLGAVPLGTPLIAGPAVLTTSLLVLDEYGIAPVLLAVTANILIAGIVFIFSGGLTRILGDAGSKALSKITSLFLAAIAVMMIRKGLLALLALK